MLSNSRGGERPVVKQFDPGGFAKGHGEIGVESLANVHQRGVDPVALAVGIAEKVHEGTIHARGGFAVPEDAQADIAVERMGLGVTASGIGEMDHGDFRRPFEVGHDHVGGGLELDGQGVLAPKGVDGFGAAGSHAGEVRRQ